MTVGLEYITVYFQDHYIVENTHLKDGQLRKSSTACSAKAANRPRQYI